MTGPNTPTTASPTLSLTHHPIPSFTLSVKIFILALAGRGEGLSHLSSATVPLLPPSHSPTNIPPFLPYIFPSPRPERWRCTPVSSSTRGLLLLQFPTLGPLSLVSGRGWGKGVVHHGCSVRDHGVGVGVGGGAGSGELPQCGELVYGE